MGFFRQGYWSGVPFPSPGGLPNPGTEHRSPTLQADAVPSEPPGKLHLTSKRAVNIPPECLLGTTVRDAVGTDVCSANPRLRPAGDPRAPFQGTCLGPSLGHLRLE